MKKHVQTLFRLALWGLLITLISCQKSGSRLSAPKPKDTSKPAIIVEEDLVPTSSYTEADEPIVKNGITYQAPPQKIKNKHAELILGRLKFEKTKITYNTGTRQMKISGVVHVLDENRLKVIATTDFEINGGHTGDKHKISLKSASFLKKNSLEKPVIEAVASCLTLNEQDEYDCSRSALDFFVAYKKELFTEQLQEVAEKKQPSDTPSTSGETTDTPEVPTPPDTTGENEHGEPLQAEGQEDSIDGRFQGHAETVDLKDMFADDEGEPIPEDTEEPVIPDTVVVIPPTTSDSATTGPTTSPNITPTTTPHTVPGTTPTAKPTSTPPTVPTTTPSTKPTTTPTVVDKPPADKAPERQEKQLSKDWQQLKSGDIRQINQSVGFPNDGRLRNATSLHTKQQVLNENAFFEVVTPSRNKHFGTHELVEFVSRMGQNLNEIHRRKLAVGNISLKSGGLSNPHKSHQNGTDVDLGYPTTNAAVKFPVVVQMKNRQYNPSSFSAQKTYELLLFAFNQPDIKIDRIFMDRTIKKALCEYAKSKNEFNSDHKELVNKVFNSIDHVDGHGDHFHVRLKCSPYDPGCRQKLYSVNKGCG